jgi:hypothetical protein
MTQLRGVDWLVRDRSAQGTRRRLAHAGSVPRGCTQDSVGRAHAPLARWVDQLAGPDDGSMSSSPRVMNNIYIYINAIRHLG